MRQYKRSDRVAALLKEEISRIILQELHDTQSGFITITKVRVSDDVRHAKIYFSVLGDTEKRDKVKEALDKAKGYIRSELGHRIKIRFVPTIDFHYDDSAEYAEHIELLLHKIKQEDSTKEI